jgi:hypothetical protein
MYIYGLYLIYYTKCIAPPKRIVASYVGRLCEKGKRFSLKQSLYEILQVVSVSIFEKVPMKELFSHPIQQNFKEQNRNQLNIFE